MSARAYCWVQLRKILISLTYFLARCPSEVRLTWCCSGVCVMHHLPILLLFCSLFISYLCWDVSCSHLSSVLPPPVARTGGRVRRAKINCLFGFSSGKWKGQIKSWINDHGVSAAICGAIPSALEVPAANLHALMPYWCRAKSHRDSCYCKRWFSHPSFIFLPVLESRESFHPTLQLVLWNLGSIPKA